jgi:Arc/MetJ-type ribon-helix-helix transcriptional regulator
MSIVQVTLPDEIQAMIDRQIAAGRVESMDAYLVEAARRLAADIEIEDEIVSEANAGIADAEAGRYVTIATPDCAEAWHERMMARLRNRPATNEG